MPIVRKDKNDETFQKCNVNLVNSSLPRLSGYTSSLVSYILASPLEDYVTMLMKKIFLGLDIPEVYKGDSTPMPIFPAKYFPDGNVNLFQMLNKNDNWPYFTIKDYSDIYRSTKESPSQVINNLLTICQSEKIRSLNAISQIYCDNVIEAAKLSDERYQQKSPLSVVDGVPFFVEHCINIDTYNPGNGCSFDEKISTETADCVQAFIDAGAILMGTVSMTSFGFNAIGFNASKIFPSCLNPWDINRYAGGSSTGSAIVVAAGLCPFAIGIDTLGSIRIPAALNGVVGLRPTFSRISQKRIKPNNSDNPQFVIGTIACCARDAAIVYHIMASYELSGETNSFVSKIGHPHPLITSFSETKIKKLRFAYNNEYNKIADSSIFAMIQTVIDKLKSQDISVTEMDVPFLYEMHIGAMKYTGSRVANTIKRSKTTINNINDIYLNLVHSLSRILTYEEMEDVNKERTRAIETFQHIFDSTDIFVLPTTGCVAQLIFPHDDYNGFYDDSAPYKHILYSNISTFIGIPSITLNVGYDSESGMPIGVQLMSEWWREDILVAASEYIESLFPLNRRPGIFQTPSEIL